MTATDLGLPASVMVDAKRHLTPEWLHALGEIEQLGSLKTEYSKIADAGVTRLLELLTTAEQTFADILSRGVPNNIVFSNILQTEASASTGVPHDLGTLDYIPMVRDQSFAPDYRMSPISFASSTMPTKNQDVWSLTPDPTVQPEQSYFTFTIS